MASMDIMDKSLPISGSGRSSLFPSPLNKSMTINESMLPSFHEAKPLERFAQVKAKAMDIFTHLLDCLTNSQTFLTTQRQHTKLRGNLLVQMIDDNTKVVTEWVSQSEGIRDIISRRQMKIVFFGRTSNGKSTCINAMLHDQVLPTGFGHTTCCFCSVMGTEEKEGFLELLDAKSDEEGNGARDKMPLTSVDQLVNALQDDKLDAASIVRVHWPKERCELLAYEVELVDSPGIDIDDHTDTWIDRHCLDADVFVLVANSESTLNRAEKRFFYTVSQRLSSPNVFILNNRWDTPAVSKGADKVRQQHTERCEDFLVKELKSVDSFTAKERIYFVSGKEVVEKRTSVKQDTHTDPGVMERRVEFESFERKLLECLSTSAVRTKFSQHVQKGAEVVDCAEKLMREIEQQAEDNLRALAKEQVECRGYLRLLEEKSGELAQVRQGDLERFLGKAGDIVRSVCTTGRRGLSEIADKFEQDFTFEQVREYQNELVAFIDEKLTNKLNTDSAEQLTAYFHKVVDDVTKRVLPPIRDNRDSLDTLGQETVGHAKAVTFRLNVRPDLAHLLHDFDPDLEYHFFLSPYRITSLLGRIGLFSLFTSFTRFLPPGLSSALQRGPVLPALVAVGAFGGSALLIQKVLNWKVLLTAGCLTSGYYVVDRYLFTDDTKLGMLKSQLVARLDRELRMSEPTHVSGCVNMFRMSLDQFLQGLGVGLDETIGSLKLKISEFDEEKEALDSLKEKAAKLKNDSIFLRSRFGKFRSENIEI